MEESKVVLVTGAAKRIGACIAETFHRQGFRVVIHYNHSWAEAKSLEGQLNAARPDSAVCLRADFTSRVDVDRLGQEALSAFGQLDVLVNNASSFYPTRFGECTQTQWDDLVDSNLRAAFFLSHSLSGELINRRGATVNIVDACRCTAGPLFHLQYCQGGSQGHDSLTGPGACTPRAGQWRGTWRHPRHRTCPTTAIRWCWKSARRCLKPFPWVNWAMPNRLPILPGSSPLTPPMSMARSSRSMADAALASPEAKQERLPPMAILSRAIATRSQLLLSLLDDSPPLAAHRHSAGRIPCSAAYLEQKPQRQDPAAGAG